MRTPAPDTTADSTSCAGRLEGHRADPWEHEPNRGFLRSLAALSRAAGAIGETEEEARCQIFLADSSAAAVAALDGRFLTWDVA